MKKDPDTLTELSGIPEKTFITFDQIQKVDNIEARILFFYTAKNNVKLYTQSRIFFSNKEKCVD